MSVSLVFTGGEDFPVRALGKPPVSFLIWDQTPLSSTLLHDEDGEDDWWLVIILMTNLVMIVWSAPLSWWSSSNMPCFLTGDNRFNYSGDITDGDNDWWPNLDHFLCSWSSSSTTSPTNHKYALLFSLSLLCSAVSDLNDDQSSEKPLIQEPCIFILFFSIRIIIMVCKMITNFVSVYSSNSLLDGDSDTFSDVIA